MGQDSNYVYAAHTAFQRYAEGTQTNVGCAVDGSLKVSTTLPSRYELAKAGRLYVASSGTHAGKAPVAAVPTTSAAWALYNGNDTGTGGTSLYVLGIGFWLVSGTNALNAGFFAGVSPTVQASAITTAALCIIKSSSGSSRTTAATLGVDATLAGTPAWACIGGSLQTAAAGLGGGIYVRCDGQFVVRPGFAMGVTVLSGTGTSPLWGVSIEYAEIESYLV